MSKIIVHDMTLRDGMHPQRHQTTVEQMIAMTGQKIELKNDPARFRKAEQTRVVGDNRKLCADTGWAPRVSMQESLAEILNDWRARA